ncbi:MAG: hypothetical protein ACOYT8_00780 [Candidatus Dependentiae bacterium]
MNNFGRFSLVMFVLSFGLSVHGMNKVFFKLGTIENKTNYKISLFGAGISWTLYPDEKKEINQPIELKQSQPIWKDAKILIVAEQGAKEIETILEIDHGLNEFNELLNSFITLKKTLSASEKIFKDAPTLARWKKRNYTLGSPIEYVINIKFAGEGLKETKIKVNEQRMLYEEVIKETKKTSYELLP